MGTGGGQESLQVGTGGGQESLQVGTGGGQESLQVAMRGTGVTASGHEGDRSHCKWP